MFDEKIPCPECGGIEGGCYACDGEGWIDAPQSGPDEGMMCPSCNGTAGMHDPGCPENPETDIGPDPDRYREAVEFDKFMDVTLIKESRSHGKIAEKSSPQRQIARKYQEHPLGKIRVGGR